MRKEIKKYVAFNPASSEEEEWWTASTLDQMKRRLMECLATNANYIQSLGNGRYRMGEIDIYKVSLHPKVLECLA